MAQNTEKQYVFGFGPGARHTEGDASMKAILGARGASLAEMARHGLPVPPGFTISTEVCSYFTKHEGQFPGRLMEQIREGLRTLESLTGRLYGDPKNPLLLSIRCSAAVQIPGLLETVLNLGLNDQTLQGFRERTGNARAAWDCFCRLVARFGALVPSARAALNPPDFELERTRLKEKYRVALDSDLLAAHLRELCELHRKTFFARTRTAFPQNPMEQLRMALVAAFASWNSERAQAGRKTHKSAGMLGTAVTVSAMVFGNLDDDSGAGWAVTRNGITGGSDPVGQYLHNAQGSEIGEGGRPPRDLHEMPCENSDSWKAVYAQLMAHMLKLEQHYKQPQEIEFTVESGTLWLLQSLPARRTGRAAARWAVEMATGQDIRTGEPKPQILRAEEALQAIGVADFEQVLFPLFDVEAERKAVLIHRGAAVAPGAAAGRIAFSSGRAWEWLNKDAGAQVILAAGPGAPLDAGLLDAAQGVLLRANGPFCPVADLARARGKGCARIPGAPTQDEKSLRIGGHVVKEGDWISLNGFTGSLYEGAVALDSDSILATLRSGDKAGQKSALFRIYRQLSDWADKFSGIEVRLSADDARSMEWGRQLGAEGVGLCKLNALLEADAALGPMREYAWAADETARAKALSRLLPALRQGLEALFKCADGLPIGLCLADGSLDPSIRLQGAGLETMARTLGLSPDKARERQRTILEDQTVAGLSGCRLLVLHPGFCRMQARAIAEAAVGVEKRGLRALPEILIPAAASREEFDCCARTVRMGIEDALKGRKIRARFPIGALIASPRAALAAESLAEAAELFLFDLNALTHMTLGYGADDLNSFLPAYLSDKLLPADPFQHLDMAGVGALVEWATSAGREARPDLKFGACGEQAGDPSSVKFMIKAGLKHVSCLPCRVPIARLAAAQAALRK